MYNSIISIVLLVVIVSFSFLTEYRATKIEGYKDVPTCEDENVPMCSYNIDEDALNQDKVDMDNFMLKTEWYLRLYMVYRKIRGLSGSVYLSSKKQSALWLSISLISKTQCSLPLYILI